MNYIFRNIIVFNFALCLLFISGCSTQAANGLKLQQDDAVSLAGFNTFSVNSPEIIDTEVNAYFDTVLSRIFRDKGLKNSSTPDLLVVYQIMTLEKRRLEMENVVHDGVAKTLPKYVAEYYGGIAVQLIDVQSNKVIWKAIAGRDTTNDSVKIDQQRIDADLALLFAPVSR